MVKKKLRYWESQYSDKKILLIGRSYSYREILIAALEGGGYSIIEASNSQQALESLNSFSVSLVIVSLGKSDYRSLNIFKDVKTSYRLIPTLALTVESDKQIEHELAKADINVKIIRGVSLHRILAEVSKLI